jgi:plasmid rolling circle replication initiator protein Rep
MKLIINNLYPIDIKNFTYDKWDKLYTGTITSKIEININSNFKVITDEEEITVIKPEITSTNCFSIKESDYCGVRYNTTYTIDFSAKNIRVKCLKAT